MGMNTNSKGVISSSLLILGAAACSASPGENVASSTASAITTADAISRAEEWVGAELHYCQARQGAYDGDSSCWAWEGPAHVCDRQSNAAWNAYRSDCSGFVTWSWGLPAVGDGGYVTGDFAPFDSSFSHVIDGNDLQPGDAVNKSTNEHIVLFKQWITPGQSAVFMEEPGCSSPVPYAHEFSSAVSISGSSVTIDYEGSTPFVAIRFDGMTSAPPATPANETASAVSANADGRLEAFVRWSDDSVHHDWQASTNQAGQAWDGWAQLNASVSNNPVAVRDADGRVEAFARGTDGAIWHAWQTTPGGSWSAWASLGGHPSGTVAVARNADGRLEAFIRDVNGSIFHIWQTTSGGTWSAWASLGGAVSSDPAAAVNEDGRVEIFARASNGALWHAWQTTPGGSWSEWANLEGDAVGAPIVARNRDGRLEVFARQSTGEVRHDWQETTAGTWSGWSTLGGDVTSDLAVAMNADGRLEIFAVGSDARLWHAWQTTAGQSWSSWANLGGSLSGEVSVAVNHDGRLETFARASDGAFWHDWQTTPGGSWNGLASLGGKTR